MRPRMETLTWGNHRSEKNKEKRERDRARVKEAEEHGHRVIIHFIIIIIRSSYSYSYSFPLSLCLCLSLWPLSPPITHITYTQMHPTLFPPPPGKNLAEPVAHILHYFIIIIIIPTSILEATRRSWTVLHLPQTD
ncbi:hypothetical protein BCR43DRAFT_491691 [Syncephalastrum racemosum]|uniref:Uncharacterized protein n=1 Tax=Syncephalastrum racemosum TaxID=13706 RepID=A0A1X2HCB0_SYNRA|nr:hypothetical protein BCR43DRAFT_491691 [Syncephalastrum racemosum]